MIGGGHRCPSVKAWKATSVKGTFYFKVATFFCRAKLCSYIGRLLPTSVEFLLFSAFQDVPAVLIVPHTSVSPTSNVS